MKRNITVVVLSAVATFFIGQTIVLSNKLRAANEKLIKVEQEYNERIKSIQENAKKEDLLSDWDKFTLALMKVESNYESTAVSSVGAKGYFQITPIYVAEVNRVHKTNYVYEDVVNSFEKSYEVFTLMQEAHNKEYCMDEAIRLHNGDHKWYRRRVYKEMNAIEKYEQMRQLVKDANLPQS
jgi:hypothetical protein